MFLKHCEAQLIYMISYDRLIRNPFFTNLIECKHSYSLAHTIETIENYNDFKNKLILYGIIIKFSQDMIT